MKSILKASILGAIFAIALFGCSTTQSIEAQLATGCNSLATTYLTAAGYRAQGKLSMSAIATLTTLEPAALAACNKNNPPNDLSTALANVQSWLSQWALINAGVK